MTYSLIGDIKENMLLKIKYNKKINSSLLKFLLKIYL